MKASELRVGNYLYLCGWNVKVVGVREDGVYVVNDLNTIFKTDISDVRPIPITEELLLKIGFKKDRNEYFNYRDYNDELSIRFSPNYTFIEYANLHFNPEDVTETNYSSSLEFPNTLHLHTLQNIWHLLTGKELEIKL